MALRYLYLCSEQAFPELVTKPFRAVIVAEIEVDEVWRNQIAAKLVEVGCLYVVAWGIDCEEWHDSVDWANLEAFDYDVPDESFVMTTWHNDEPLSEAFWFSGNCASHPDVELYDTIILHISNKEKNADMLQVYRDSQEMSDQSWRIFLQRSLRYVQRQLLRAKRMLGL